MNLKLLNGGAELAVSDATFGQDYNETLVHQVVVAYRNAGRAGTKRQLSKAEVRGGGKKPHAQKGTGQARAGSSRSPIWRGGGVTFAARPRDFAQKVNRKMYRGAIVSMLSELVRQNRLVVTDEISLEAPKTKLLASKLAGWSLSKVLIVVEALGTIKSELRVSRQRVARAAEPDVPKNAKWNRRPHIPREEFEEAVVAIDAFPRCAMLLTVFEGMSIDEASVLLNENKALVRKAQRIGLVQLTRNLAEDSGPDPYREPGRSPVPVLSLG